MNELLKFLINFFVVFGISFYVVSAFKPKIRSLSGVFLFFLFCSSSSLTWFLKERTNNICCGTLRLSKIFYINCHILALKQLNESSESLIELNENTRD